MSDALQLPGTNVSRSSALRRPANLPCNPAIYMKIVERPCRRMSRTETGMPTADAATSHHKNLGQDSQPRRRDDVYQPTGLQHQTANPT